MNLRDFTDASQRQAVTRAFMPGGVTAGETAIKKSRSSLFSSSRRGHAHRLDSAGAAGTGAGPRVRLDGVSPEAFDRVSREAGTIVRLAPSRVWLQGRREWDRIANVKPQRAQMGVTGAVPSRDIPPRVELAPVTPVDKPYKGWHPVCSSDQSE